MSCPQDNSHPSLEEVKETRVLKTGTLACSIHREPNNHIELQLPEGSRYRAGDYLAILPKNPPQATKRVIQRFKLPSNASLFIGSEDTFLPHGVSLWVCDVLGLLCRAELASDSLQHQNTAPSALTMHYEAEPSQYGWRVFSCSITAKGASILDLLEAHPATDLPFATYLAMLP